MTDDDAIRRLLASYCHTVDDGRFDEFEQLWAENASLAVLGQVWDGRAAVRAFMQNAQPPDKRGKHVTTNAVIEVDGAAGAASAVSDFLFVAKGDGQPVITQVGRYLDRFVRDGDGWRFAERRITLGFS